MEDRRRGTDRRATARSSPRRPPERRRANEANPAPASLVDEVPWRSVLPMVVLALVSIASWRYSQSASIDEAVAEPIAYSASLRTPLLSARRVPETLQQPLADAALAPDVNAILSGSGPATCLVIREGDRTLNATNAQASVVPASNQKILSTYAVLDRFGPDHTFRTTVTASSPISGGRVNGDLFLIGGGDPFLTTDAWRSQYGDDQEGRTFSRLEDLADAVVQAGVTEVTGGLIADESLFDDRRFGPWAERLIASRQSGPLSALSVNEGFRDWPAEFAGSFRGRTPAEDPALNAAAVFAGLLGDRGVTIVGGTRVSPAPVESQAIAQLTSPPLRDIITHVNSYSNNYGAEILVKYLGRQERGIGSTAAGVAEIQSILESAGFDVRGIRLEDGSGLSEANRVTCGLLTQVLEASGPDGVLVQSLSVGGERGSLALLLDGTPADGMVFAKTGTLNGVTALSGIARSASSSDVELVFTYIANGESVGLNEDIKALQEPFIEALVAYPDAPLLSSLGPLQP